MRALELDFQRRLRPSGYGWLLLVAGVLTLAGLLQAHRMLAQQAAAHDAAWHRVQAMLPSTAAGPHTPDAHHDAQLRAAREVIEQSKRPWSGLFTALESADSEDVALLAVAPDIPHLRVKIHAEARDLAAMLAFYRHLQQSDALTQVVLIDHVVSKETPERPVRFHLDAGWGGNRESP
jgi:Tfp pilus assembly protein PilN